jgi:3-isopropylmalate/(R)-2-methylmalate dehydratase small subunit
VIEGTALRYLDDDVNTDLIWPGRYTYQKLSAEEMGQRAMEGLDPDFPAKAARHSVLVVGRNFGCGSSREQAAECLRHAGMRAVVGRSFARIFFRNAINLGLPAVECDAAVELARDGDGLRIDLTSGRLTVAGQQVRFAPYPDLLLEIIEAGGLVAHVRARLARG